MDLKTLAYAKFAKLALTGGVWVAVWLHLYSTTAAALSAGYWRDWLTPGLLMVAAIPLTVMAAVFFGPKSYFLFSTVLALGSLAFFRGDVYALLGAALLFFGFWRAYHRAQFELLNNIKFAPSHITRSVGRVVLLAFLLMLSFQVYAHVALDIADDEQTFYARLAEVVTRGVLPIVERQIPGFEPDLSLDQFIVNGFAENSQKPTNLSSELIAAQLAQSRSQLTASLGIKVSGQEPLSRVAQLVVEEQIRGIVENFASRGLPLSTLLPAVYALGVFSLLRILSFLTMLAAETLSVGWFWALRLLRFYRINPTQILAERVEI